MQNYQISKNSFSHIAMTMDNTVSYQQAKSDQRAQTASLQEHIEAAIIRGEFSPGDRLDESRLAKRFGVSRTPIREAFKSLVASRLAVKRQHTGVFVVNPPLDEIMEMFELMATLESFAAEKAAHRATPSNLTAVKEAHENCIVAAKTGEPAVYFTANQVFHEQIYKAAHNSVLHEQIIALDKRLAPYRRLVTFRPHRIEESNEEHAAILSAIEQHATNDASLAMGKHLDLLAEDALTLARATKSKQLG